MRNNPTLNYLKVNNLRVQMPLKFEGELTQLIATDLQCQAKSSAEALDRYIYLGGDAQCMTITKLCASGSI